MIKKTGWMLLALWIGLGTALAQDSEPIDLPSGGKLFVKERRIEVDGKILINRGLIELFACSEGGQDHESILLMSIAPAELNLALLTLGFKNGDPARGLEEAEKSTGDRVIIEVRTLGDDPKTYRAEDLVWNKGTDRPLDRVGFVYVGSAFKDEVDPDTGEPTGNRLFLASLNKSLMAVGDDPSNPPTILDNPLPWNVNDSLYYVHEKVVPPVNTPVTVIVRAPNEEELKEMLALEEKLIKEARDKGAPDVEGRGLPGKGGIDEKPEDWDGVEKPGKAEIDPNGPEPKAQPEPKEEEEPNEKE